MALQLGQLSTAQVAGLTTTQVSGLFAVQCSPALSAADVASINNAIIDDQQIISRFYGPGATAIQAGIIFTATTTDASASMTSVSITSPSTATIAAVQPGMYVTGPGLTLGTRVLTAASTTITLSTGAISGKTGGVFVVTGAPLSGGFDGHRLFIPNRGTLNVLPTDYVFIDNFGFPYLVPATSVGASGSGKPFIVT